jgi:hypothetical protein
MKYRTCPVKNWPAVQEEEKVKDVKEVRENAPDLGQIGRLRNTKTQRAKILG